MDGHTDDSATRAAVSVDVAADDAVGASVQPARAAEREPHGERRCDAVGLCVRCRECLSQLDSGELPVERIVWAGDPSDVRIAGSRKARVDDLVCAEEASIGVGSAARKRRGPAVTAGTLNDAIAVVQSTGVVCEGLENDRCVRGAGVVARAEATPSEAAAMISSSAQRERRASEGYAAGSVNTVPWSF